MKYADVNGNGSNSGGCFDNKYVQLIHKYADTVLLLSIAMLSYWLVDLAQKQDDEIKNRHILDVTVSKLQGGQEEIMRSLSEIKGKLVRVEDRLYKIPNYPVAPLQPSLQKGSGLDILKKGERDW